MSPSIRDKATGRFVSAAAARRTLDACVCDALAIVCEASGFPPRVVARLAVSHDGLWRANIAMHARHAFRCAYVVVPQSKFTRAQKAERVLQGLRDAVAHARNRASANAHA